MTALKKILARNLSVIITLCLAATLFSCQIFGKSCPYGDLNNDHICDDCGERISYCADGDFNHLCDICGAKLTECGADTDTNHKCDICGVKVSECVDEDRNHVCEYCKKTVGLHLDVDPYKNGHKCSHCGEILCRDGEDAGHDCDVCGANLCVDEDDDCQCDICDTSLCIDETSDHICDICGNICSDCVDEDDEDHNCDICKKNLCFDGDDDGCECDVCRASLCYSNDDDHTCDECGRSLCYDGDDYEHRCDVCGKLLCLDGDDEGCECDICGEPLCIDENENYRCDICQSMIPVISVYVDGAEFRVNGDRVVRIYFNQTPPSILPSCVDPSINVEGYAVYNEERNLITLLTIGEFFTPTGYGKYYIEPVISDTQ